MFAAAEELRFEYAAKLRDEIKELRRELPGGRGDSMTVALVLGSVGAGTVIGVLVSAFVTGGLARFAVPGPDPMPIWLTILIGLAGSLGGGSVAYAVGYRRPVRDQHRRIRVAILLVVAYRRFVQRRAIVGREAYRFPKRGFGVAAYRDAAAPRRHRPRPDRDRAGAVRASGSPCRPPRRRRRPAAGEEPTENPAHYPRPARGAPRRRRARRRRVQRRPRAPARAAAAARTIMVLWFIIALAIDGLVVGRTRAARAARPGSDGLLRDDRPRPRRLVRRRDRRVALPRPSRAASSSRCVGATLLLYLHRRFVQHRPLTGPGATAAAAALGERAASGERPVVALPDVREHRERRLVDLVDVQAARLAEPARARLPETGRDRDDDRLRASSVDDLELVPLADGRLVDVAGEDQVGAGRDERVENATPVERRGASAPPATALRSCGGGGRRRGTRLRLPRRGARPRREAAPRAGRRSGGDRAAPS